MIVAVDFDGTCVTHDYPLIGRDIGAVPVLRKLVAVGHQIILFTMRSGTELQEAVEWFKSNDIPLYGINTNPTQKEWTASPKAYAQLYIDDAALGAPLSRDLIMSDIPFIDWQEVVHMLGRRGIL